MAKALLVFFCCLANLAFAQIKISGLVLQANTDKPVAFATVRTSAQNGTVCDIDGRFSLTVAKLPLTLQLSCLGYQPVNVQITTASPRVFLANSSIDLQEFVVKPGVNPALRIIKQASDNRAGNDPEQNLQFSYKSYNKLFFTLDKASIKGTDIAKQELRTFLDSSYLFFTETYAERHFASATKNKETILATKISGLQNPAFGIIGSELQSFSFYEDLISINAKKYLNPLCKNSENLYNFELIDTNYSGIDTVFVIRYSPKKGKNFDGLSGSLFINTHGYAIQQVTAAPLLPENYEGLYMRIQQQYQQVEGYWFPEQLNTYLSSLLKNGKKDTGSLIVGEGKSYISEVKLNPLFAKNTFGFVVNDFAEGAGKQSASFWEEKRTIGLSKQEEKTYNFIDSIGKIAKLDQRLKLVEYVIDGKIPFGIVSLRLNDLLHYNQVEGYRVGLGLSTNKRLSKFFSLGGYLAYGFKDKRSKYGADAHIYLARDERLTLDATYQNDLLEPGSVNFRNPLGLFQQQEFRQFLLNRLDEIQLTEITLGTKPSRYLSIAPFVNDQYRKVSGYSYYYGNDLGAGTTLYTQEFYTKQAGVNLRFAYGEKNTRLFGKVVAQPGVYPVLLAKFTRSGIDNTGAAFSKIDLQVDQTVSIKLLGDFTYRIAAGYVDKTAPYPFLYNAKANFGSFLGINSLGSFEVMRFNEFLNDQYLAIHLVHDFKTLLYKGQKFSPGFRIATNVLWGSLQESNKHVGIAYTSAQKPYLESGVQFTNIYKLNQTSSLGLGVYYRYGAHQLEKLGDNFALKINLAFNLD